MKESLVQEEKPSILMSIFNILNLINTDPNITSTQIREKLFENYEDIKISVGTIYKILKDNDFQWIASSIIPINGPEQQKLRINWCKRHKDRNLDDEMSSDE